MNIALGIAAALLVATIGVFTLGASVMWWLDYTTTSIRGTFGTAAWLACLPLVISSLVGVMFLTACTFFAVSGIKP